MKFERNDQKMREKRMCFLIQLGRGLGPKVLDVHAQKTFLWLKENNISIFHTLYNIYW